MRAVAACDLVGLSDITTLPAAAGRVVILIAG
jgi:hypothetical protein